jgi:hypothetical protein
MPVGQNVRTSKVIVNWGKEVVGEGECEGVGWWFSTPKVD